MADTRSMAPTLGAGDGALEADEGPGLSPEIPFLRRFKEARRSVIMSPPPPPPPDSLVFLISSFLSRFLSSTDFSLFLLAFLMEANKSPRPSCGAGAPSGGLTCPTGGGGGAAGAGGGGGAAGAGGGGGAATLGGGGGGAAAAAGGGGGGGAALIVGASSTMSGKSGKTSPTLGKDGAIDPMVWSKEMSATPGRSGR